MSDRSALMTRRRYFMTKLCLGGANVWLAKEAIASTAIEHPEWDMEEVKTWNEWEKMNGQ